MTRAPGRWSKTLLTVVVAAVGSISLLALGGLAATPASAASGAPAVAQCNPPDFPITAGFQVTCTVSVENYTSATGATSSTVTTSACLGAAGVVYPSCPLNLGPVTSTTNSTQLVTSVNQCNGIVTGGGSNVYCNVSITNHVPAGTPESGVTTNQCIGTATGSTMSCNPTASTTNATVTQCNGSVTGGGTYAGQPAAGCTVTGAATADPVTINQCNDTAIGGGSAVTCAATVADVFAAATTTPTPTSAPTGTSAAGGSGGASGEATGAGAGAGAGAAAGAAGGKAGAAGSTGLAGTSGTVAAVIPTGAPQTGFGGASQSTDPDLVLVGGVALAAAGLTIALMLRRRHRSTVEPLTGHVS